MCFPHPFFLLCSLFPSLRSYLETLLSLPWSETTPDVLDINKAREDLDNDHYGLEEVKKRILEYLAVRKLKNSLKGRQNQTSQGPAEMPLLVLSSVWRNILLCESTI